MLIVNIIFRIGRFSVVISYSIVDTTDQAHDVATKTVLKIAGLSLSSQIFTSSHSDTIPFNVTCRLVF